MIRQINDGQWLFKALLAPKPHQEHIYNIDDFVWRFYVNYIPLNAITHQIQYPIPRCDTVIFTSTHAQYHWLLNTPMGYHQFTMSQDSQEKLAFQGTDAIKWTWNGTPFGPTNGPATFITLMHDMKSIWWELATSRDLPIGEDLNSTIIVDDIFNWAMTLDLAFAYFECHLLVCRAYRLSLNLHKCKFFPSRLEFVGIDVCADGNRPALSKRDLLRLWPNPVGFGQFYSRFIPNFELSITPLRELMKNKYTTTI
jgi:hypothetical protein